MTMKAMREHFSKMRKFDSFCGGGLTEYYDDMQRTLEALWKNGYTTEISDDFLKAANGYQINTSDYENIHICQTYDLRSIAATKAGVKALADFIIN